MCLICGFVGCCDTSKNKHMLAHVRESGHPIIRSIQHGEAWIWCYRGRGFDFREVRADQANPA
jgi:uncharacterized UBP type Zn finger protein